MNRPYDYDLIVIGSGPAGEKGAAQAAWLGKKVALIERAARLGGAGLNTGTIPSKTLRETAQVMYNLRQRGLHAIDFALKDDLGLTDFMSRKQTALESEWGVIQRNVERHNIDVIWGEASFGDAHTVRIHRASGGAAGLTAGVILIASGSSPYHPADIPFDQQHIFDPNSILEMDRLPRTLAVIGGGVISTEYASIFGALGVQVTLVDTRERLLPMVDGELAERLRRRLEQTGLRFIFNAQVDKMSLVDGQVQTVLHTGQVVSSETALIGARRQSNIAGLGLENVGVTLGQRGVIVVNDHYQTVVPNIYAAGDVIGFPTLASTSMEQARLAMLHAFDPNFKGHRPPVVPLAIYTIPEIALAGLSEEDCLAQRLPYLVGRAYYARNARGQIIGDTHGLVKLVFSPADRRLLGVHIIGEMASELVHLGAYVLSIQGKLDSLAEGVYNYPSLSDAYKYAAYDGLGRLEKQQKSGQTEYSD